MFKRTDMVINNAVTNQQSRRSLGITPKSNYQPNAPNLFDNTSRQMKLLSRKEEEEIDPTDPLQRYNSVYFPENYNKISNLQQMKLNLGNR